jgi:hypothetical protein
MKRFLAKSVLIFDKHAFDLFLAVCYAVWSVTMLASGWVGFFIWLTASLLLGIVLGRPKAVEWAIKNLANKE